MKIKKLITHLLIIIYNKTKISEKFIKEKIFILGNKQEKLNKLKQAQFFVCY
jgi:hypothetical protein